MNRIILSLLLVLGGAAVFVLGSPYYTVFPTNGNQAYYVALTVCLFVLSIILKKKQSLARYWPAAYALFVASTALLFLSTGILNLHDRTMAPLQFLAMDKLSQFLHVVPVLLGLTLVARDDLKSIFIARGRLRQGLVFGLVSFVVFAAVSIVMQPDPSSLFSSAPATAPWLLLFILTNAIMEELWFRGIFLRRYESVVGRTAAIVVTALVFGASHISATYDFPGGGLSPSFAAWEDLVYSLARSLKTLRVEDFGNPKRRWKQRSPAMASGLTDHIWTVKELLKTVVAPNPNNT